MKNLFVRFVREDAGQDLIEYTMLATLVALVGAPPRRRSAATWLNWYNAMASRSGWAAWQRKHFVCGTGA